MSEIKEHESVEWRHVSSGENPADLASRGGLVTKENTLWWNGSLCLLNARSVKNKTLVIKDFVVENDIDMMALTETWLNFADNNKDFFIRDICPTGYKFIHTLRAITRRGGTGLLYKKSLKFEEMPQEDFRSFEFTDVQLFNNSTPYVRIIIVYRPSPSVANGLSLALLFDEFSTFLEQLAVISGDRNCCGRSQGSALIPLLKKVDSDFEVFSNFRQVLNLMFTSKLIEKAVARQLTSYVLNNDLGEVFQSAYKKLHSTETALLKVQNDILRAIDSRRSVILVFLDLSAALIPLIILFICSDCHVVSVLRA